MNLILDACESSVIILALGNNLKMVCTATMVLQSVNVSSSSEFEASLFTITTLSAWLIPARSRSSNLKQHNQYSSAHRSF